MKRVLDWIRLVIISPEFVIILLILVIACWRPSLVAAVGDRLKTDNKPVEIVFGLPLALLAANWGLAWKILFPSDSLKARLAEWEHYQALWDRVVFGLALSGLATVVAVVCWLCKADIPSARLGSLMLITIGVPTVVLPTFALAALTIRRITDGAPSPNAKP
jgi:hypothetical protein